MATRTINLYPSSDINVAHSKSSGNSGFSLINDTTDDNGSTSIYQSLSADSATQTSTFNCSANTSDNPPAGKIKVKSVSIETYWRINANQDVSSVTGKLTAGVSFGDSSQYTDGNSTTSTTSSSNYTKKTDAISGLSIIDTTFNSINDLNAKLRLRTTGIYVSSN